MGVQVDLLTRGKTCHEKEFIDFEFDGKHISEFGMVAVFDGDRHSFNASPEFEDETSEVNGVSGQYYWGTRMKTVTKSFSLATDGITEAQVNAFKLHFKPGKYGKFIEDKLACRYGWARVSATLTFSVVPFIVKKEITINGVKHIIEVNEYKGTAKLTFVFDDPFFYATNAKIAANNITDATLREAILNNIPIENYSWSTDKGALFVGDGLLGGESAVLNKQTIKFYNPSTAPTKAKLSLTFMPKFTGKLVKTSPVYFAEIADTINGLGAGYNSIIQKNAAGDTISQFRYTSPNILYQTNRAIKVAADFYKKNINSGWLVLELEEALRLEITNPKVIGWATAILRILKLKTFYNADTDCFNKYSVPIDWSYLGGAVNGSANWFGCFNLYMLCITANYGGAPSDENKTMLETTWTAQPYTVHFDSELSQTTIDYTYNSIVDSVTKIEVSEEKCGDMICSPYLKLDGGDSLDAKGIIISEHTLEFFQGSTSMKIPEIDLNYTYTYL